MDPTNQPMSLPLPFEGVAIVDEKLGAKPFEEPPLEVLLPCSRSRVEAVLCLVHVGHLGPPASAELAAAHLGR